ncbi:MAG: AfsR/SARP family transcriptional regulator [Egibacteraceae bacterium]
MTSAPHGLAKAGQPPRERHEPAADPRLRILGPVEIHFDDGPLTLGGPKQRTLVAVLAIRANRVVPTCQLIDALWDDAPPSTAIDQLHNHMSMLRRALDQGAAGAGRGIVVTRPPGYMLRVEPGQLDLDEFSLWTRRAREARAAGRLQVASDCWRTALGLWRGPALGGASGRAVSAEAARLEEQRLAALEERIEADLTLGRHGELVGEIVSLVAMQPLRERLRGQLMLALYRTGRQADALAVYHQGREALASELGLDPGQELRGLEQRILADDPDLLGATEAVPMTSHPTVPVPAQLPPDIADFTGRTKDTGMVCDLLRSNREARAPSTAVVVSVVTGKAGIGKTALAVHVAHRLRGRFPDGQLYVDLRGTESLPLDPGDALVRFLLLLGVEKAVVPDGVEERSALYRTQLAGRQVLVLLDNAVTEAQVRPLLPGSGSCGVIVTSRARLTGLDGARTADLDVLESGQAVELLGRIAGPERVAVAPEAARMIVRLCDHLPLAVRIAGTRLATRPYWPLARLAERLTDERRRLDELTIGDRAVRPGLAHSYQQLTEDQRRCFRRVGLLATPTFTSRAAAALLEVPLSTAEELLDGLVQVQLLGIARRARGGHVRYRVHGLPRAYARERAETEDSTFDRDAALTRAGAPAARLGHQVDTDWFSVR